MAKPSVTMSFSESRKAILEQMTKTAGNKLEEVVIQFQNDDVPNFLKALDEFEKKSRNSDIIVK